MRIDVHASNRPGLFFTGGNLPTQLAYDLTPTQVTDSFVVSLLRSPRLLLAGSFYFESASTRRLVSEFPRIWHMDAGYCVFFHSANYPSFSDHGSGKISKSPSSFSPYANATVVTQHGRVLDGLGIAAIRDDIDISLSITEAWKTSCLSDDPDSIKSHLDAACGPRARNAITACAALADDRKFDFIWQSIEPTIIANPDLAASQSWLRRKLADLYTTIMSLTLGAVESSPSLAVDSKMVSPRSIANLGVFAEVLRACSIEPGQLRDEGMLLRTMQLEELKLLQRVDDLIVECAVEANILASDYWSAIKITEQRGTEGGLRHSQLRPILKTALAGFGVTAADGFIKSVLALEKVYDGKLLHSLRRSFEALLIGHPTTKLPSSGTLGRAHKDKLVFASASPPIRNTPMLPLDDEQRSIAEAVRTLRDLSKLDLVSLPAARFDDLKKALIEHRPRFLHISAHGSSMGSLMLSGQGRGVELSAPNLAKLLRATCLPECLFLNACYSAAAISSLGEDIKYAILMSDRIDDEAARTFSSKFYETVSVGLDPQQAFELALLSCQVEQPAGPHDIPQLFVQGVLVSPETEFTP
ncbi:MULTISPECIES: CHAT domain-containing protein [unclassified Neorhizobium]|uniref:CHAT domain-containing protein n=1 Tax=unclassified Neorhizobium TaxID=2629175 RepID=UPI001FF5214B|nr:MULTISPECIES: CHAT domain-containing protein [unclassified Neorhizobium]MCJ9669449.1 CHAT domain-containing protein [Neorhizobium sp. SHOUNA12B]MCJ9745526.1 CHAT domain-containing protein [Neorhizobium sp. SHOUNA12A]